MKKVIFISVMAVFTAFTFVSCTAKTEKAAETEEVVACNKAFVCPMHPEVGSDTMTTCSKCGMDLVANPALAEVSDKAFVCPMHSEIGSDTMTTCSECGMDLVENPGHTTDSTKMDMPM